MIQYRIRSGITSDGSVIAQFVARKRAIRLKAKLA
jgi:hypothetical protein